MITIDVAELMVLLVRVFFLLVIVLLAFWAGYATGYSERKWLTPSREEPKKYSYKQWKKDNPNVRIR